jgi:ABC-type multidrug transport system fused ATPase/permease subunit
MMSRLVADIEVVETVFQWNIDLTITAIYNIIAFILVMYFLSPALTGVTLIACIPMLITMATYGKCMMALSKKKQEAKKHFTKNAQESFSNVRTVKTFANEAGENKKNEIENIKVYGAGMRLQWYVAFFAWANQIFMYGMMVTVVWAAQKQYRSPTDPLSIGYVTSFCLYGQLLCFQFWKLSLVIGHVFGLGGASEKIVGLLTEKPEMWKENGGTTLPAEQTSGLLELKNVDFTYPTKQDVKALNAINIKVGGDDANFIALVGESGSGKSTVI